MRRATWIPLLGLALVALVAPGAVSAQETPQYLPEAGDEVVIYTHKFHAEHFDDAVEIVADEFTNAQLDMGQTRRNVFLVNPTTYEVIAISFFGPGEDVDEWHSFMGRLDVLDVLDEMRRAPLDLQRYTVYDVTDSQ